jgi:trehalose 6-phosphate synthase/phosphatase
MKQKQQHLKARMLSGTARERMFQNFKKASYRIFFLDYDGTLAPHMLNPQDVMPDKQLLDTLERLAIKRNIRVVIISGRSPANMEEWFGQLPVDLVAEHGIYIKRREREMDRSSHPFTSSPLLPFSSSWQMLKPVKKLWKKQVGPILNHYVEKLPGSFVEEKEYSLAFHYRKSNPDFAALRIKELIYYLNNYTANMGVQLLSGNKVLEVRNSGVDKGTAAIHWLSKIRRKPRFILAIGDDRTDEDLFRAMPKDAYSIKVGVQPSEAMYNLNNTKDVVELLDEFVYV